MRKISNLEKLEALATKLDDLIDLYLESKIKDNYFDEIQSKISELSVEEQVVPFKEYLLVCCSKKFRTDLKKLKTTNEK